MFEYYVYLVVVNFFQNFVDYWFEVNCYKMYVMGVVKVVLQVMCYLVNVDFMCCVVKVKEVVVYVIVVMYQYIVGDVGVKIVGDQ